MLFCAVCWFLLPVACRANQEKQERHILVVMRMIGHQVLLDAGDSTSRVLPVEKKGDRYEIRFDTRFSLNPEGLVATIREVMEKNQLSEHYLVELVTCGTGEVVYSYEIGIPAADDDLLPCSTRILPEDCYQLFITLMEVNPPVVVHDAWNGNEEVLVPKKNFASAVTLVVVVMFLAIAFFVWLKRRALPVQSDGIAIGSYRFNERTMELSLGERKIELTGKEAELLFLLYNSVNNTLERELILKAVWGDDGDYIGRTLDVFISKLRKKLEEDESVKIVNIRGVGYKLVVDA